MDDVSVNFIELVALTKITPESTVEKFGSLINSSFFDASNILATLKQKGLVDFVTAFPSQSTLKLTDRGSALIAEVMKRSIEPVDQLDMAILTQLAGGKKSLAELGAALNVAPTDLAIHIYRLAAQQSLTYELVNAAVSMYLTEKGFVAAKSAAVPAAATPDPARYGENVQNPPGQRAVVDEIKVLEEIARKRRKRGRMMLLALVAIVIILVVVFVLNTQLHFL